MLLLEVKVLFEEPDYLDRVDFWLGRRIVEERRRADHRDIYLPPRAQRRGLGGRLQKQALQLYEDLGVIDYVVLESERIGRYANAKLGYDFLDDTDRQAVINAVSEVSRRLGLRIRAEALKHPWAVAALPGFTTLAELAAADIELDAEAQVDPMRVPVGKAVLLSSLCPSWRGVLSLTGKSAAP